MRFNFKKISAIAISTLMTGMTMGVAAAASYPAPFVSGGVADTAIVYGTGQGVSALDQQYAGNIQTDLKKYISSTGSSTVSGESASLADGSSYVYLKDELNENIQTITKDDLATTLADGTFTDNDGTDYDYEQTISVLAGGVFDFGNSDNDLDDPALMTTLTTAVNTGLYNLTVTFDDAVPFNATDSEGEVITLFGNTYTVGTSTDADTLVLLGGSDAQTVQIGETTTLTVGDETYTVTLNGISDAATPQASITVNGETKTFTEGQTKGFLGGDVDVFVKTVFRTGENSGHAELQVGADKLTFEDGNEVLTGSDDEEIEGTKVYISGGVNATTKMVIAVAAEDNDNNHLLVGDEFVDPVFGSVKINLASIENGPTLEGEEDVSTTRTSLSIKKAGNRELAVTATDKSGNEKTIPFTYQNATADDTGTVHLWEGAAIAEDDYFILNSGTKQHFMQMTKVNVGVSPTTDDVGFKDLFTGNTYSIDNKDFTSGQTITISGQTYTVTNVSATTVTVTSSDYSLDSGTGKVAIYPYIELVSGKNHKFAYTDDLTITNVTDGTVFELPTGSLTAINASSATETVGSVKYIVTRAANGSNSDITIGISTDADTSATVEENPALLFVEDDDKAEATITTENAVLVKTNDTGTYSTVLAPVFTATANANSAFDDSDYTGYIDSFGTYVLFDSSDANQDFVTLTYPKEQMYLDAFITEAGAVISEGDSSSGAVLVTDAEVASVSSKNLIIVGGSCINTAAAKVLGFSGPTCGAAFTAETGVGSGQFLIKSVSGAYTSGKVALVVAGYDAADTVNGVQYLINKKPDTSKNYKGTSATVAEEIVTSA